MRPLSRLQRGSTNWPFIITLLLLIVFVYLWYDCTDQRDSAQKEKKQADEAVKNLRSEANKISRELTDVANRVGYRIPMSVAPNLGIDAPTTVDQQRLMNHLIETGQVMDADGNPVPGLVNWLRTNGGLTIARSRRAGSTEGEEKTFKFTHMTQALKDKIREIDEMEIPAKPQTPDDLDDAEAQADFQAAMQNYEAAIDAYVKAHEELTQMDGFVEVERTIRANATGEPETEEIVQVVFMRALEAATVEDLVDAVPNVVKGFQNEIKAHNEADRATITQLQVDLGEKENQLNQVNTDLQTCRDELQASIESKEAAVGELNERLSRSNIEKNTAQQALAQTKADAKSAEAKLTTELDSFKEALRQMKQKEDLIIRRDDKDGSILVADPILRSGVIDLGRLDKVFVGLKFNVRALDRAGNRVPKGQVMVTRVTGNKSAAVKILNQSGTITRGDEIHNPFYDATATLHVWFAGKPGKWSKSMARDRLAKLGVVVQDALDGDTDYVIVPNSWVVAEDAGEGDEDEDAEDSGTTAGTPLEVAQKQARVVGATVITERLLDAFLDY